MLFGNYVRKAIIYCYFLRYTPLCTSQPFTLYFKHSLQWFTIVWNIIRNFPISLFSCFPHHLFPQSPSFWTVLQQGSWNWLFFYIFNSLYPEGESVSMHLTSEATHYFGLPHLLHPLFSSELRSHLSMLWVPARKNWCTEGHVLPV